MVDQFMSQTQQQRLQQVLTPQMLQSLEILQVPILELRTLIQKEMQQNPTLEEKVPDSPQVEIEPGSSEREDTPELDFKEEFEVLSRLDDEWREYFQQDQSAHPYTADDAAKRKFFFDSISRPKSLAEHLLDQLPFAGLPPEDRAAAELVIGNINEDGYLSGTIDEIAVGADTDPTLLQKALGIIQEFDPIGVGARDLKECLLLQLKRLGKDTSLAASLVNGHLDELGQKKYASIAKALKTTPDQVEKAAHIIAMLEPKPGRIYSSEEPQYVLPELQVQKTDGDYAIVMNREQIPHLRISKQYRHLMEDPGTSPEVKQYIQDKVRAGAFLIRSIHQRQETIRRIAMEIVNIQRDFFDHGISRLRPLTMAKIAGTLGIHETTVSRAIAGKYMLTPRGMFELKYFFTPGYKTTDGQSISNKTIKDAIVGLISREELAEPLSDQAVVEKLKERGITVARRTIAKYREELNILPSHLRKNH